MKRIIPVVSLLCLLVGCSDDPADCNMTSAVEFYIQNNKEFNYRGRQPDVSREYIKKHIVKKIERTGLRHNVYGTPVCKVTCVNINYDTDVKVAAMSSSVLSISPTSQSTACYVFKNSISGTRYEAVRGDGCCDPHQNYFMGDKNACWF